jgi:large subunit ribosomal protein L1
MGKRSKRYQQAVALVDRRRSYGAAEAVEAIKGMPHPHFDETVDLVLCLGVDPRQPVLQVRGSASLPHGTGKSRRVVVFCEAEDAPRVLELGAVAAGADDLIERIQGGWLDFDVVVASPSLMPRVGRLGRLLGPKGLMPSPRTGTVTPDVSRAVVEFQGGRVEYRTDAGGNLHVPLGKVSFPTQHLVENLEALVEQVKAARPAGAKGRFIRKVYLSTSMGPAVPLAVE